MDVKQILKENIFNNFILGNDKELDEIKLNNKAQKYFYEVIGIYNENIEKEIAKHIKNYLLNKKY